MIKGSPAASMPRHVARDALRAANRARQPTGWGMAVLAPELLASPPDTASEQPPESAAPAMWVGDYRLTVDDAGALIAVHEPTGRTRQLFNPFGDNETTETR